jgi:hypothetical protein
MNSGKIFCIGMGKTGTTSLEAFFRSLDYRVGIQSLGEILIHAWAAKDFDQIISFARSADVFQDIPFSCPYTYQILDSAFSGAKFILSVRDNPDQWYNSLVHFHTEILGKDRIPTAADLREFPYRYRGWIYDAMKLIFSVNDAEPYEKTNLIHHYVSHNKNVTNYFANRPNDLLIINLSWRNVAEQVSKFVGRIYNGEQMPHLNSSRG